MIQLSREDLIPTLDKLDMPIRAINSDRGTTNLGEWEEFYEDFEEVVIPESHHMLVWQHPQIFNDRLIEIINKMEN